MEGRELNLSEFKIEDIGGSARLYYKLYNNGIRTVEDLVNKTENDIMRIDGIGNRTLEEIKTILNKLGLSLKASPEKVAKSQSFANDTENIRDINIEDIGISVRLYSLLYRSGIRTVGDILSRTETEIKGISNLGSRSFRELENILLLNKLSLK